MSNESAEKMGRRKFLELAAATGGAALVSAMPGCAPPLARATGGRPVGGAGSSKVRVDHVHDVMAGYVRRGVLPGVVTLVSHRGQVRVDAIGVTAVGGSTPMRRDTIFRIASMTKPITAAATMVLVEEGKVRLDEPVDRLLPELANRRVLRRIEGPIDDTVPAKRPITVRDLLAFTMGFGIVVPFDTHPIQKAAGELRLGQGMPRPHEPPAPDEWIRRLGTLPLMYQPGDRWVYNTGSDVLGVLIARASGRPLEAFFRERIFEPLGMKDTGFSVPAAKLHRLPPCYRANPATGALEAHDGAPDSDYARAPAFPSGASGLLSTADDFLAFAQMMLNGGTRGRERILSARSVEMMTADQLTPAQKVEPGFSPAFFATRGWGFGVSVITHPDDVSPVPGRYGWYGGFGTHWFNDPAKDLVGVLMTQRVIDQLSPAQDFWKAVYRATAD